MPVTSNKRIFFDVFHTRLQSSSWTLFLQDFGFVVFFSSPLIDFLFWKVQTISRGWLVRLG